MVSLRLPADELTTFLPQILEGILLWAEDSKNKFRAKVGLWVGAWVPGCMRLEGGASVRRLRPGKRPRPSCVSGGQPEPLPRGFCKRIN